MSRNRVRLAAWCVGGVMALGVVGGAGAGDEPVVGSQVLVRVKTGEAFLGTLVSADEASVMIDHPTLGRLQMPRSQVLGVMSAPKAGEAIPVPAFAGAGDVPPTPPPPPAPVAVPASTEPPASAGGSEGASAKDAPLVAVDPESFWRGWKGSAELGINGASGNSENFAGRAGLNLKRETSVMVTTLGFSYNYGTSDGDKNTDRGRIDLRNDWKLVPSKWRVFVQGSVEYDAFQDWDWRTSVFAGVAYELIKTDSVLFLPKAGIGIVKEFGGSDNRIRPEALGGFDFEWKIKDGHKFFVNFDSYWNLLDTPQYRLLTIAGYELMIDKDSGMALKLGIEDRYQSNPGGGNKKNDLLYFATLVWNF